jgi:hypothetical protein
LQSLSPGPSKIVIQTPTKKKVQPPKQTKKKAVKGKKGRKGAKVAPKARPKPKGSKQRINKVGTLNGRKSKKNNCQSSS